MPTVSTLVQASVDRYAQQSTAAQAARKNGGTGSDTAADTADLAQRADDLQAITDSLLASTDKLLAGLTDVAGSTSAAEADLNKGAEGSLPEQTVTVDQIKTSATPEPTPRLRPPSLRRIPPSLVRRRPSRQPPPLRLLSPTTAAQGRPST